MWTIALLTVVLLLLLSLIPFVDGALFAIRKGNDPVAVWKRLHNAFLLRHIPSLSERYFTFLLSMANPFSNALSMRITSITQTEEQAAAKEEGRMRRLGGCRAVLWETPGIRNPFKSIHAAALVLFGETVSGLAVFAALLPKQDRAIVTRLSIVYHKKSRGEVTGECLFQRPTSTTNGGPVEAESIVTLKDKSGDKVAELTVYWTIDLDKKSK